MRSATTEMACNLSISRRRVFGGSASSGASSNMAESSLLESCPPHDRRLSLENIITARSRSETASGEALLDSIPATVSGAYFEAAHELEKRLITPP